MRLLYNLGIRVYYFLVLLASIGNEKAKRWIQGRRDWQRVVAGRFGKDDKVIWFHCASLGEFEQGRPLIEKVKSEFPQYKILLTFFSPSGYEKRKNFEGADVVSYLPLDTAKNARKLLKLVPVEKAIFIKYEFWYHILRTLNKGDVPVYLAAGNFRPDQIFFRWYGAWYRKFLQYFTHIFVQNSKSEKLLKKAGIKNVSIAGDTRFERVAKIAAAAQKQDNLLKFAKGKPLVIAGSTWERDEEILLNCYRKFIGEYNWIIAPHEPTLKNLNRLQDQFTGSVYLSQVLEGDQILNDVIIVDTIGHLSSLYQYGTVAYIGGGFGKGIHNILEAAAFGKPLLIGPNYLNFSEALDLISVDVAYVIKHKDMFHTVLDSLVNNENRRKIISKTAENYIIKHSGATDKIVDFVFINPI